MFKTVRCPFCDCVITESTLEYDFSMADLPPTNRYKCRRCKRIVYYRIKSK